MRTLALAVAGLATLSLAAPPLGTAKVESGKVTLERGQGPEPVDVGCVATSAVVDQQLHVACDDGRLRVFSLEGAPTLVRDARVDGEVRSLFLLGDEAWVELTKVEARPVKHAATAAVVSAPPVVKAPGAPTPATSAPEPGDTLLGPARATGVFVAGGLRVMIPIGVLAIAATLEASATWHAEAPFALTARVAPLGGVTATNAYSNTTGQLVAGPPAGVASGELDAMFDGRYFAVGLGFGFGQAPNYDAIGFGVATYSTNFTVAQVLRVGALDGLSLSGQTQVVLSRTGFSFFGGEGTVQIPIQRKWLLQLRGGGQVSGFFFGEVAMRIGLGDAPRAHLFLVPMLGFAAVRGTAGPAVGLGVEYRFGP